MRLNVIPYAKIENGILTPQQKDMCDQMQKLFEMSELEGFAPTKEVKESFEGLGSINIEEAVK
jgi:hypothetical protein